MQEIDLTVFADLKTMAIVLGVAFLALSLLLLTIRLCCKEPFRAGQNSECTRYSLMVVATLLLAEVVCLVICWVGVTHLKRCLTQVGNDFVRLDPDLPPEDFYYGTSELRSDFEKIRRLSVAGTELVAQSLKLQPTADSVCGEMDSPPVCQFLDQEWPQVETVVNQTLQNWSRGLRGDIEECDRAIGRIDYIEKRFLGSTDKLSEKVTNLLIALGLLILLLVIFLGFCVRGLFKTRGKTEGSSNWPLAKRLWGLSALTIAVTLVCLVVGIVTASANNAIVATKDVLKKPELPQASPPFRPFVESPVVRDFSRIVRMSRPANSLLRPVDQVMREWDSMVALQGEKEDLIRKVDDGLQRGTFGPVFRRQQSRLYDAIWGIHRVIFNTLMWLGVLGFGYIFVSLLIMA